MLAAVTSEPTAVQGCSVERLGTLRYVPAAAPAVAQRWRHGRGPDWAAMPMVVFNEKDTLQHDVLAARGVAAPPVVHRVPTSADFVEAICLGRGWGMVPEPQLAIQLDALRRGELALLLFELERDVEQPFLYTLGGHRLGQEGEVIAEHEDRGGIVDLRVFADELLEEDCRHRRHVFVSEPDIRQDESFVTGLDRRNASFRLRGIDHPAPGQNFFAQRHRPPGRLRWMQHNLPFEPGRVVVEQPAVFDDPAGDLTLAGGERGELNAFTAADLVQNREVRRGEDAEVLAILAVDALDAFGHDELNASTHLRVRLLFA